MAVMPLTLTEFQEKINQYPIALIDFWASWCGPCKMFSKTYEAVSIAYPEIAFFSVNVENETALADEFQIRSIPHLMVIKQGIVIYSDSGNFPESTLKELVAQAIAVDVSQILETIPPKEE